MQKGPGQRAVVLAAESAAALAAWLPRIRAAIAASPAITAVPAAANPVTAMAANLATAAVPVIAAHAGTAALPVDSQSHAAMVSGVCVLARFFSYPH